MANYSIGDRVEVRWEAELLDAAVTHVHSSGKVDVVYDIDNRRGKEEEDVRRGWLLQQSFLQRPLPSS